MQAHAEALIIQGRPGLISIDLLHSAVERPYNGYYRSIYRKAAALLESLACNHAFVDGNKRTALLMVDLLIRQSGYLYATTYDEAELALEALVLGVAEGRVDYDTAVQEFKRIIYRKRLL